MSALRSHTDYALRMFSCVYDSYVFVFSKTHETVLVFSNNNKLEKCFQLSLTVQYKKFKVEHLAFLQLSMRFH